MAQIRTCSSRTALRARARSAKNRAGKFLEEGGLVMESSKREGARKRRVGGWLGAAAVAGCVLFTTPALAGYDAAPGYAISAFATDFQFTSKDGVGPIGLAFGGDGELFVADRTDQNIYAFGRAGGVAGASTRINATPIAGSPHGLAFGKDGRLYLALTSSSAIVEIDPADGSVLRTVTKSVPCPVGIAIDPLSGDLFASSVDCTRNLFRISNPGSASPHISTYASGFGDLDGITFSEDGTLWAGDKSVDGNNIFRIHGTADATPGAREALAYVSHPDGIALQENPATTSLPFLFVNRTDGNITRVNFAGETVKYEPVMTGGSRGDFVAVGPDRCLYAVQTDRVIKVTAADGTCTLQPTTTASERTTPTNTKSGPPASSYIKLPSNRRCLSRRRLRIRLVRHKGVTFVSARISVNGRRVKTVRGRKLRLPIDLRGLPKGRYRVTVSVRTSRGRTITVSRRYRTCTPKPRKSR
jgi:hypothetical protein